MPKERKQISFFGEKNPRSKQKDQLTSKISKSKQSSKPEIIEITFNDYFAEAIRDASRIRNISSRRQRYSGAQFEVALIQFADIKMLKTVMDKNVYVDFDSVDIQRDWTVGFDWLDLAVSYRDTHAIEYFQTRLEEDAFRSAYEDYKKEIRPDCTLINYEQNVAMGYSV
ncbi:MULTISPECIES: hypothetical protein [Legionella]|uniref:Uncharacterized protein n=1 Tax=Legionella drozanskii LLAP-1 TaxID=1212489 RepID=A0A0W0SXG3_9GAMM|nr:MULTISPECIES: hypothetical protein [Legionella]KTC88008.1 hypothetical protein Ldro_1627 [Legionella drozanskii LLAP-1]